METEGHGEHNAAHPLLTLQELVTRLWMHPLVSDITHAHRARLRRSAETALPSAMYREIALIPFGSTLWIPKPDSDFDVRYIVRPPIDIHAMCMQLERADRFHIHGGYRLMSWDHHVPGFDIMITTLLCPDNFIAGNVAVAAEARLEFINIIDQQWRGLWEDSLSAVWRVFRKILYWDRMTLSDWDDAERYGVDVVLKDKPERFKTALSTRARQERRPRKWRRSFENARQQMELPPFDVFKMALRSSQGYLPLDPRFAAEGISTDRNDRLAWLRNIFGI